LGVSRVRNLV